MFYISSPLPPQAFLVHAFTRARAMIFIQSREVRLMARYRDEFEDERDYRRGGSFERDRPWNYNRPFSTREEDYRQRDFGRERFSGGRFGERADYQHDEPRYSGSAGGYRDVEYERSGMDRDYGRAYDEQYGASRSRLRCREIMTRDLAVATRDTALSQIASMMKDEDTGVIPVVDFESNGGDGSAGFAGERRAIGNSYSYGRLIGLVTDRDIAIRAVAEDKDCRAARAERWRAPDRDARFERRAVRTSRARRI